MPLYEYKCLKCNRRTEKIDHVNGPHLKKCPHCGGKMEAMFSAPALQFKGAGWYVSDYGGKKPASEPGKTGDSSSDKKDSTDSSSKDSTTKESASKDSKESSSKESKDSKETKKEKPAKK